MVHGRTSQCGSWHGVWCDRRVRRNLLLLWAIAQGFTLCGCGTAGGSASGNSTPPNSPPAVSVTVTPVSASLFLGQTQQFTAAVSGSPNSAVTWSVNGIAGGNAVVGTISPQGLYTAPNILPSSTTVTVIATSQADPQASGSATVTVKSDVQVVVSPASASLQAGQSLQLTATVTGTGNPSTAVNWSLTGSSCPACGTLSPAGNSATYAAPATVTATFTVTIAATSVADPGKTATATITVNPSCAPAVTVSPAVATVQVGQSLTLMASVCANPAQAVSWSIAGSGCSGTLCGTVSSTGPTTAVYTAPGTLPPTNPVQVIATNLANPAQQGAASVTIRGGVSVSISPLYGRLAVQHRLTLTPTVIGTTNTAVSWSVNGVLNGTATSGTICLQGSNPCQPPAGPLSGPVDFLAPSTVPSPATVTLTATSAADSSAVGYAQITILPQIRVTVLPVVTVLAPGGSAYFTATVEGTVNTSVSWSVSCSASSCGTISSAGYYTAPQQPPNPNTITVIATSQDDPTQSGQATVVLSTAVAIVTLVPASTTAGAADPLVVQVNGFQFTTASPGSTVLVNGSARPTTCASSNQCQVTLTTSDLSQPGVLLLSAQNPDGSLSNSAPLVIAPPPGPPETIALTGSQPLAGGRDIVTVEPTNAASGGPPLTILFVGVLDPTTATCTVTLSPVTLQIPSSGTTTTTLCLGGYGLNPSFQYSLAGGTNAGLTLSGAQWFNGSLIALTLTVSATTPPGPRALLVTDPDGNTAALTGAIDLVQP
jgi:hypothetical protein